MNVPLLRFKGFEEEWEPKELGKLLEFKNGINADKDSYGHGTKFINVLDILNNNYITSDKIIGSVNASEQQLKTYSVTHGDILFLRSSETREDVGKCNVYLDGNKPAVFGGFVIRGKKIANYSPYFLKLALNNSSARNQISSKAGGSTRYNVGQSILSEVEVRMPSEKEQKKVSAFFMMMDLKIKKQEEKIEKLEQFKKGMMQKLFSQELRFQNEDGGEFPEWEETFFGEVITNKSEKFNPKKDTTVLPCIELENIEQRSGQLIGNVDNVGQQSLKNKFEKGSVLFGKLRPYLNKYWYAKFNGLCSTEIWVLNSTDTRLINEFMYFFIQGVEFLEAANKSIGSKMPRADWNSVSELPLKIPIIQEQEKIAGYLRTLENKVIKEKEKLMVLEEQKKGFMQRVFVE